MKPSIITATARPEQRDRSPETRLAGALTSARGVDRRRAPPALTNIQRPPTEKETKRPVIQATVAARTTTEIEGLHGAQPRGTAEGPRDPQMPEPNE